uniref:heavy-metal-associated domain-containing protein n=1 Tax=Flavobacterium sp. TaxID=239 RepID=UPI00404A03CC
MKKIILVLLLLSFSISMQAQEKKKNKNAKYTVGVNGNCEMCKKRIEKAAFLVKGVKSADWHTDHKDIHLIIDENKCTIEEVQQAIAAVGHDTDLVKADDEVYANLHGCCQYERKE